MVIVLAHIRSLVEVRRPDRVSKRFRMPLHTHSPISFDELMLRLLAINTKQSSSQAQTVTKQMQHQQASTQMVRGPRVQGSKGPRVRVGLSPTPEAARCRCCAAIVAAASASLTLNQPIEEDALAASLGIELLSIRCSSHQHRAGHHQGLRACGDGLPRARRRAPSEPRARPRASRARAIDSQRAVDRQQPQGSSLDRMAHSVLDAACQATRRHAPLSLSLRWLLALGRSIAPSRYLDV